MSAIYVQRGDQQLGPFTTEELEGKVAAGELSPEDLFWSEGMEDWQPLTTVITIETGPGDGDEETADDSSVPLTPKEVGILHKIADTTVTTHALHLECGAVLPLEDITKVSIQTEAVRRGKPLMGCIILGVLIVSLALAEIPRLNATHWVLWGLLLAGLVIWWFRLLLRVLQVGASMVVIDLKDGDERIIPATPETARQLRDAIRLSLPTDG